MIQWTDLPLIGAVFNFYSTCPITQHYLRHKRRYVSLGNRFCLPQCGNCDVTRAIIIRSIPMALWQKLCKELGKGDRAQIGEAVVRPPGTDKGGI